MSKRYDEAIEVVPDPVAQVPLAFSWRGRRYEVDQQLSSWREGSEWWAAAGTGTGANGTGANGAGPNGAGPSSNGVPRNGRAPRDRECFRVLARPAGALATGELDADGFMTPSSAGPSAVYDLAFDRIKRVWRLARIWD